MTIRQVHVEGAMTKAQYDALDLTRPLCDAPIGATTGARRSTDEAASRCFDEPAGVSGKPRWRPVGPARTTERLELDDQRVRNRRRGHQEARTATQTADRYLDHPRNGDDAA